MFERDRWWAGRLLFTVAVTVLVALGVGGALALDGVGVAAAAPTDASTSCSLDQFRRPDGSIDTTGYLNCVSMPAVADYGESCPTADVELVATADPSTLPPGAETRFRAVGFAPGSSVVVAICSRPAVLGTFTAGADGSVDVMVTIPPDTALGPHTLVAVGNRDSGLAQVAYAPITVTDTSSPSAVVTGSLPTTGAEDRQPVALGAALVVLGVAALVGSRAARRPADRRR